MTPSKIDFDLLCVFCKRDIICLFIGFKAVGRTERGYPHPFFRSREVKPFASLSARGSICALLSSLADVTLGMIAIAIIISFTMSTLPLAADEAASCADSLTFRWTSGDPIRLDVLHPVAASLANPPFLRDPEIVSAVIGRDFRGENLTISLGTAAAGVLAVQTKSYLHHQMLIMLGNTVVTAAMVMSPLGSVIVLHTPDEERLKRLNNIIQKLVIPRRFPLTNSDSCS